jgi:DNA-binding transcriptional ArsR family regulator
MTRPSSSLVARLARLEGRVSELEQRPAPRRKPAATRTGTQPPLALLDDLMKRRGPRYRRGPTGGALAYAGFLQVDERRYAWARETAIPELLDADAAALARVLAGMASPQRIALLRALAGRDRTSAELAAVLGDVSAGHAYHHIRELQASGVVVQVQRGVYRIAPPAMIPVAIILAGAADIAQSRSADDAEPFVAQRRVEAV